MSIKAVGKDMDALVNVVIAIAIALTFLGKMQTVGSITTGANTALTTAIGFVDDFFDWGGLIVLILVIVYLKKQLASSGGTKE